jgi:hypothetical protein
MFTRDIAINVHYISLCRLGAIGSTHNKTSPTMTLYQEFKNQVLVNTLHKFKSVSQLSHFLSER